jgi:hypothetical protein
MLCVLPSKHHSPTLTRIARFVSRLSSPPSLVENFKKTSFCQATPQQTFSAPSSTADDTAKQLDRGVPNLGRRSLGCVHPCAPTVLSLHTDDYPPPAL